MPLQLVDPYLALPAYMLILARVAGLMLAAPVFSGVGVPMQIKALLAAAISLAVFPLVFSRIAEPVTMQTAVVGLIGEIALGLVIGFGVALVFMGVQLAIQMASQQAGMALGTVYNPMFETSMPVVASLYYYVAICVFLVVGGHRALVRTLLDTFEVIPPLGFRITEDVVVLMVDMMMLSFVFAIRVGAPLILALLLAFMTLGFISRTMPQLNILTIGFPLKITIALIMMALTIMSLETALVGALTHVIDHLREGLGLALRV